jgi:thioester reductase-like protein
MLWRRSTRLARWAFVGWTGYLGFWLLKQLLRDLDRELGRVQRRAAAAAQRAGRRILRDRHGS